MLKVIITAPKGVMDRQIVAAAFENEQIEIVGGLTAHGRDYVGKDIGIVAGLGFKIGAKVYDDVEKIIEKCDVVIDFSVVDASIENAKYCEQYGKAFFCGTTGFSDEQIAKIDEAGKNIPVLRTANTSYVVAVMRKLLAEAARLLGDKCNIDVIDYHSNAKLDSPSGTALELAEAAAKGQAHKDKDITFHSIRSGNIPSSHDVIFGCSDEVLKISHEAYNMNCFARGACEAALFLGQCSPGIYDMDDMIDKQF